MDGPNVNWAAFEKINSKVFDNTRRKLTDVGYCGTLHNAFVVNASEWDVLDILFSLDYLKIFLLEEITLKCF